MGFSAFRIGCQLIICSAHCAQPYAQLNFLAVHFFYSNSMFCTTLLSKAVLLSSWGWVAELLIGSLQKTWQQAKHDGVYWPFATWNFTSYIQISCESKRHFDCKCVIEGYKTRSTCISKISSALLNRICTFGHSFEQINRKIRLDWKLHGLFSYYVTMEKTQTV